MTNKEVKNHANSKGGSNRDYPGEDLDSGTQQPMLTSHPSLFAVNAGGNGNRMAAEATASGMKFCKTKDTSKDGFVPADIYKDLDIGTTSLHFVGGQGGKIFGDSDCNGLKNPTGFINANPDFTEIQAQLQSSNSLYLKSDPASTWMKDAPSSFAVEFPNPQNQLKFLAQQTNQMELESAISQFNQVKTSEDPQKQSCYQYMTKIVNEKLQMLQGTEKKVFSGKIQDQTPPIDITMAKLLRMEKGRALVAHCDKENEHTLVREIWKPMGGWLRCRLWVRKKKFLF